MTETSGRELSTVPLMENEKEKPPSVSFLDDDFNLIFVLDTLRQGVFGYADGDSLFGKDGSLLPCLQHHQKACAGNPVGGFIEEL